MLKRIHAEYLEMPGTRLKLEQVQRLCGIEPHICKAVLAALVDARFLRVTPHGAYVRVTDGLHRRLHPAKGEGNDDCNLRRKYCQMR